QRCCAQTLTATLTTMSFFCCHGDHRDLPSFPTRRSSDLDARRRQAGQGLGGDRAAGGQQRCAGGQGLAGAHHVVPRSQLRDQDRSEEHTSELQSRENLVCRLLLEKKKKKKLTTYEKITQR